MKKKGNSLISKREEEVLYLISQEYTIGMISNKMYISHHTVVSHRKNLMSKLGVKNMAGIVRRGFELGFLSA